MVLHEIDFFVNQSMIKWECFATQILIYKTSYYGQCEPFMEVTKYLRYLLMKILGVADVFPTRTTSKDDLNSHLQSLHPVSCNKELIRLGPQGDGGYLIPNDLEGIEACFSPGVSFESGFEKDCADLGMKIFLADKSIDQPAETHKLFYFTQKFIGVTTNNDFMTINNWVTSSLPESHSDLLLQMDIEGYEYEVILSMADIIMRRFRIIVVEFHQLHMLWSMPFFSIAARAFDKILQTHACVHIHPNNCCGSLQKRGLTIPRLMEFTFLRNDRITNALYQNEFPNPLDSDNYSDKRHITLPECWYKGH